MSERAESDRAEPSAAPMPRATLFPSCASSDVSPPPPPPLGPVFSTPQEGCGCFSAAAPHATSLFPPPPEELLLLPLLLLPGVPKVAKPATVALDAAAAAVSCRCLASAASASEHKSSAHEAASTRPTPPSTAKTKSRCCCEPARAEKQRLMASKARGAARLENAECLGAVN
jgi:hypothetical protein